MKYAGLVQSYETNRDSDKFVTAVIVEAVDKGDAKKLVEDYASKRDMEMLSCHDGYAIYEVAEVTQQEMLATHQQELVALGKAIDALAAEGK
jgi:hypothetical protein